MSNKTIGKDIANPISKAASLNHWRWKPLQRLMGVKWHSCFCHRERKQPLKN